MVNAVHDGEDALKELIDKYPELVNDISTGGAQPLHMCGMSRDGQVSLEEGVIERRYYCVLVLSCALGNSHVLLPYYHVISLASPMTNILISTLFQTHQLRTAYLIARGGDIEAVDTYGYRPLHRMASNNLALGAEALLAGGAQVDAPTGGGRGETALSIARSAGAADVVKVLAKYI